VLLIADTHHMKQPIQTLLTYAASEPFDYFVFLFDLHHAHFFAEYGFENLYWLPGLCVTPYSPPFNRHRKKEIVFVGQVGKFHPMRQRMIMGMQKKEYPLRILQCPHSESAYHYNKAQITFNCSLNGDLNLRIFEVLAAGGFLVTDRLSPQSGLEQLFQDKHHLACYDSMDDLFAKLDYYLAHPDEAIQCAEQGCKEYYRRFTPDLMTDRLWDIVFNGKSDLRLNFDKDLQSVSRESVLARVGLYEFFQELHRHQERVSALFFPGTDQRLIRDISCLPRFHVRIAGTSEFSSRMLFRTADGKNWDMLVAPGSALTGQNVKGLADNASLFQYLVIPDANSEMSGIQSLFTYGFTQTVAGQPVFIFNNARSEH